MENLIVEFENNTPKYSLGDLQRIADQVADELQMNHMVLEFADNINIDPEDRKSGKFRFNPSKMTLEEAAFYVVSSFRMLWFAEYAEHNNYPINSENIKLLHEDGILFAVFYLWYVENIRVKTISIDGNVMLSTYLTLMFLYDQVDDMFIDRNTFLHFAEEPLKIF